ncbi:MAG: hypothetical protein ABT15_07060 [Pseudonocardia sp. SCN 73-27]|nr:MAG: hypothetical protein ABS80_16670 [Pseudonocardia sp. SCN 72-51]ODV07828.1 MAG: hypothetical protein ABT15_07060 [Pseudonocardia sp. SCN 73-27]
MRPGVDPDAEFDLGPSERQLDLDAADLDRSARDLERDPVGDDRSVLDAARDTARESAREAADTAREAADVDRAPADLDRASRDTELREPELRETELRETELRETELRETELREAGLGDTDPAPDAPAPIDELAPVPPLDTTPATGPTDAGLPDPALGLVAATDPVDGVDTVAPSEVAPVASGPAPAAPPLPQRIAEPLTERGRDLLRRDLALDAVEVLRQAVAAGEPSSPDVLADAYLDSGSFHAAAEWLGLLVARGYVRFAGRLGVALAEIGDRDGAEEALRIAIANGESAAANDLGILLRDMGRDAEAVQVLVRAAEHGDGQAADNLVSFLLDADELAPAVAAAERYYDTGRPDTVVALADARSAARRDEEAEEFYRLAGRLGALRAHVAYASFLLAGRADRVHAEQQLREAVRHREPGAAAALGVFLIEDGRVAEGRDHLVAGASSGDRAAGAALAELDGEDPDDD